MKRKKTEQSDITSMNKQEKGLQKEEKALTEKAESEMKEIQSDGEYVEQTEIAEKDAELLLEENKALREKHLRKMAELENYRKRAAKEKSEAYITAKMRWARELLPVIDNFERALSFSSEDLESPFRKGIELIHRQLLEIFNNMGVTEIEAVGEKFNPQLHEAIETQRTDQFEKDIVLEVKRKGYLLDGRLLRPSYVGIALPLTDSKKE